MKILLKWNKSVEQNAEEYFEKSKKAKKKIDGAMEAVNHAKKRLEDLKRKKDEALKKEEKKQIQKKTKSKKEWFEKFRWFISSEGFLCIGGRDATSNEVVIKKHTDKEDIVFHTDMAGSPFFVIKKGGKDVGDVTLRECADATVTFSRAWRSGMITSQVFYVSPDQLSKTPNSGEYIAKGSFIVRGKTNYMDNEINLAVGIDKEGRIMGGPVNAIRKNCENYIEIQQGNEKTSAVAKLIKKKIGGDLDDIIRVLPAGGCKVKNNRKR